MIEDQLRPRVITEQLRPRAIRGPAQFQIQFDRKDIFGRGFFFSI